MEKLTTESREKQRDNLLNWFRKCRNVLGDRDGDANLDYLERARQLIEHQFQAAMSLNISPLPAILASYGLVVFKQELIKDIAQTQKALTN